MDKNFHRLVKKADRIFAALDKGDRSQHRYAQLAELRQELDALMPHELPPFLKKTKAQSPDVQMNDTLKAKASSSYPDALIVPNPLLNNLAA